MTWTKLSDDATDDPALLALPRTVRLVHFEALVWANRHGTDGSIPKHMLPRITDDDAPVAAAEHLVAAGKWVPCEGGWEILGFLDDQPSADDVRRTRDLARLRQRRQRQHRAGDHELCDARYCPALRDKTRESRVTASVTNAVSHDTPTRPVPTRPGPKEPGPGRGNDARTKPACDHKWTNDGDCVRCHRHEPCTGCRQLAHVNDTIRCHEHLKAS